MAFTETDLEPITMWLNYTGMCEAELGQKVVGNPEALNNLRKGTAPPATLLAIISFIKRAPSPWARLARARGRDDR